MGQEPAIGFGGRVGLLPLFILNSLSKGPRSGYDIIREIGQITEGSWQPGSGSIYPVLRSLEKKGLIKPTGQGSRGKRIYLITQAGLRALQRAKEAYDQYSFRRWRMIRGIMMTLVEPKSLARMLNEAIEMQPESWERVLSSKDIGREEKLFLLKQHLLMLDRHYEWVKQKIRELEKG